MAEKSIEQLTIELELTKTKIDLDKENNELLKEKAKLEIEIQEKKQKSLNEEIIKLGQIADLNDQEKAFLIEQREELKNNIRFTNELKEKEKERLETLKQQKQQFEAINKALKEEEQRASAQGKKLANLLGISESQKDSLTYRLFNNPKQVMDGFKGSLEDAGGFLKGSALSILMKIQEATLIAFQQNDAAISSFVAATGASSKYNDIINATARGNTALGISFAESGKAVTALYENLNTFTTLSTSAQASLTVTAAKLEKLGISGGETAKSIQTLSMMMGISEVQAAKTVEKFAAMGQAIGVSSKQMISDFTAVKDQLAVFGKTMDETFIKLEAQSKATGVAINDLLTLTNKFDTFEGAAGQVAKLNAVLGGSYISAMSMIETTDPTERINMIRDAVNDAGMSFESMSYYEKKAIADAGGFKSVEEAQRILSMSAGEAAEELQRQQASQKQLNDAIERAQPIQEKLSLIMANFAIVMSPVVDLVSTFLSYLAQIIDNPIGGFIFRLALYIGGLLAVLNPVVAVIAGFALALTQLHDVLLVPHSPVLFVVLINLSDVFDSIGNAAKNMADSIANVAKSFVLLHDSVAKNPTALFAMAEGLLAVGAALTASAYGGLAQGFASLFGADISSQIKDISESLQTLPNDNLVNFKVMMEKIVEVSEPATLKGFEKFSEKFDLVAQATAKVDASKTQTFTQMLTATQNLSQALNLNQTVVVKIGSDKFKGVIEKIIDNKMPDNSTSAV